MRTPRAPAQQGAAGNAGGKGCEDMNHFRMTKGKSKQSSPSQKQSRPADAAFDVWLNRSLHQLYDDVAKEPVPEELLKLIQEHRDK